MNTVVPLWVRADALPGSMCFWDQRSFLHSVGIGDAVGYRKQERQRQTLERMMLITTCSRRT